MKKAGERVAGEKTKKLFVDYLVFLAVVLIAAFLAPAAAFAADAPAAAAPAAQGGLAQGGFMTPFQFIFGSVQFFLIGFFIYFWMAIRPEQLRADERRKFVAELKKNDEVMTSGGIIGKIVSVKDDTASLEIGGNVKVRVHVDHISPLPPSAPQGEAQRLQNHLQKTSE